MEIPDDLAWRCRQLHGSGDIAAAIRRCGELHDRVPELSLVFHESMILRIGLHLRGGEFFRRVVKWFLLDATPSASCDADGVLAHFAPHDAHVHIIGTPCVYRAIGQDLATFGSPAPLDEGPVFCVANAACDRIALAWNTYGRRQFLYRRFDDGIALADMRGRLRTRQRALRHLAGVPDGEDPVARQRLERQVRQYIRDGGSPQVPVPVEAALALLVPRGSTGPDQVLVAGVAAIIANHVHPDDLTGETIDQARLIATTAIVRERLDSYLEGLVP